MSDFEANFEEINKKIDYLVSKVNVIERRLFLVEKLLDINNSGFQQEGEQVAGAVENQSFIRCDLLVNQIVDKYQNNSQWLASKAIRVSLLSESLLQKNNESFFFNFDKKGNYWIIATTDDNYYLLPKGNFRVNAFNYDTLKKIFQCDGYEAESNNQFALIQPAKVSLTPSGKQWIFTQPGLLSFHSIPADELQYPPANNNQKSPEETSVSDASIEQQVQSNKTNENEIEQLDKIFTSSYNKKPSFLAERAITVSETLDNKKQRVLETSQSAIFQNDASGKYWIFSMKINVIYLVPQWDARISDEDVTHMRGIFECRNYKPEYANNFKLLKPAKVSLLNHGENWVFANLKQWLVIEAGVIEFLAL